MYLALFKFPLIVTKSQQSCEVGTMIPSQKRKLKGSDLYSSHSESVTEAGLEPGSALRASSISPQCFLENTERTH